LIVVNEIQTCRGEIAAAWNLRAAAVSIIAIRRRKFRAALRG
jgi:hypothetical protein